VHGIHSRPLYHNLVIPATTYKYGEHPGTNARAVRFNPLIGSSAAGERLR
jgi:hypothetical protein